MATKNSHSAKVIQFVKDQVEVELVKQGCPPEKACELVAHVTPTDVEEHLPKQKMGAIGDGSFLKWIKENGPQIAQAVQQIVSILSLFKSTPPQNTEFSQEDDK